MSELRRAASRVKRLVREAGQPVAARIRPRIEHIADERIRPEVDALRATIGELREELERVDARCDDLDGHVKWLYDEQRRLAPHLSALETRVAAVERPGHVERYAERLEYSAEEADEVRAEHARIRARLSVISKYEERLGRLEEEVHRRAEIEN